MENKDKKEEFITPEIEITVFDDEEDIIQTSGVGNLSTQDFNDFFGF